MPRLRELALASAFALSFASLAGWALAECRLSFGEQYDPRVHWESITPAELDDWRAVFIGTVVSRTRLTVENGHVGNFFLEKDGVIDPRGTVFDYVVFEVRRSWKGTAGERVPLLTDHGLSGIHFEEGETYVVFAEDMYPEFVLPIEELTQVAYAYECGNPTVKLKWAREHLSKLGTAKWTP